MNDNNNSSKQINLSIAIPKPQCNDCVAHHKMHDTKNKPIIKMTREAFDKMMFGICSKPVESGGLMLGQIGSNDVSDFYFDDEAEVSGTTYSPNYKVLTKKLKEEWIPAGIDFKGISHSHPGMLDRLTNEDLIYIRRLLIANTDMQMFIAPIIVPQEFRMRMMVVFRDNPTVAVEAQINFF